jgi:uncharacterized protein (DUF362 family)
MENISRRDFIRIGTGILFASILPVHLLGREERKTEGPIIGVAHGTTERLVSAAVDAVGGIKSFITEGDRVCIKPNISFGANIDCGTTTSSLVVKQLVNLCLSAGAYQIYIADHTIQDAEICVEKSDIEDALVDRKRVHLVVLKNEKQFEEVPIPRGKELKDVKIAKLLNRCDKLINVPTAKSHSATGVSLGMKNLMGLVWNRYQFHRVNLHRAIAELSTIIKPDLIIMDATRALVTGGPGGPGEKVMLDTVIAGTDPVAVDSYTVGITTWYGRTFTGSNVKYIVEASRLGLGEIDIGNMDIRRAEV